MTAELNSLVANRVYIVVDDAGVLRSIEALLAQAGFVVKAFLSAQELLSYVELDSVGCVIADLKMPDINGSDLARQLLEADSTLAVIVISGVGDVAAAVSVMENGAVTFLEKPCDQSRLTDAVGRALAVSHERWETTVNENGAATFGYVDH